MMIAVFMKRSLKTGFLYFCLSILTMQASAAQEQPLLVGKGERLMVQSPHPDDGSAGLIKRVIENGGSVRTVVVTSGDAYVDAVTQETGKRHPSPADYLDFGEKRLEESRRAAQILGNGFVHLDLLGFSDGSIYSSLVSHWRRNNPMRSDFTGFDHVPYREAEDRGYAQDGQDLLKELVAIMLENKPTLIAFPDVMEDDSDHAGLGMFSLLAVHDWLVQPLSLHANPRLLTYFLDIALNSIKVMFSDTATIYRWTGFGLAFLIIILLMLRQHKDVKRYKRFSFWTDVAHTLWFYIIICPFIIVSFMTYASTLITTYIPFLSLNLLSDAPPLVNVLMWLVCTDFTLYWLHRTMHKSKYLWVFHKIHHSQNELNPLTTSRTHFLEHIYLGLGPLFLGPILGSFAGYPMLAISILAALQFAHHSSLDCSFGCLGKVFVSPCFHGRHHSNAREDIYLNFGSTFVIWDFLFKTGRNEDGREILHGLNFEIDDVPRFFIGQQLYPLIRRKIHSE
jgi:sterol desaturase/sphingolipid hydroxylase (fatty acid hydroxylase superfamily)/LmbE family N-acetylglucosaminyl deacetylase